MAEWKTCKLSDLGDIVGGATPSTKDESNYGGELRLKISRISTDDILTVVNET